MFAVLGSDLTNLLYAPEGVRVLAAAPADFGDRFFYALVQLCRGQLLDLRGPVTDVDEHAAHRSDFRLDMGELAAAADVLLDG